MRTLYSSSAKEPHNSVSAYMGRRGEENMNVDMNDKHTGPALKPGENELGAERISNLGARLIFQLFGYVL